MQLNKWHCYEVMKLMYMATGKAPTFAIMRAEFPEIRATEILEGMAEFKLTIGKFEKGA